MPVNLYNSAQKVLIWCTTGCELGLQGQGRLPSPHGTKDNPCASRDLEGGRQRLLWQQEAGTCGAAAVFAVWRLVQKVQQWGR